MSSAVMERNRLRVILATVGVNITVVFLLGFAPWSDWRTGLALNLFDNALLIAFAIRYGDVFMLRLLAFGLGVGIVELTADAWLVDYTRTLNYTIGGGPMLWRSPIWMPLAWQIVTVQFGYIGLRLWDRWGLAGLFANGILGAINIPFYEEMARRIQWWQYRDCRMVSFTPHYIIVGEFLIAMALGALAARIRAGSWGTTLLASIAGGLAIFVAYVVAFALTDGLPVHR